MKVIASVATVSQLVAQAIELAQKVHNAYTKVRDAGKKIHGYGVYLDAVNGTLRLVSEEPELQTDAIADQVRTIVEGLEDAKNNLEARLMRQAKSKGRQFVHALAGGDEDERKLEAIFAQLDRARSELIARILITNVGITGSCRRGYLADWSLIQNVAGNALQTLGQPTSGGPLLDNISRVANGKSH